MDTRTTGLHLGPLKKQCSFENQEALDRTDFRGLSRDATAEAINQLPLTAEAQGRSQSSACNINPLPSLTPQSARDLNVPRWPNALSARFSMQIKCPLKKKGLSAHAVGL
jgi:hypothetical protein